LETPSAHRDQIGSGAIGDTVGSAAGDECRSRALGDVLSENISSGD
jgi:hypothetical protein